MDQVHAIADVLGLSLDAVWARPTNPNVVLYRPALVATHVRGWPRKSQTRRCVGGFDERERGGGWSIPPLIGHLL